MGRRRRNMPVRRAVVAGQFYPSRPEVIERDVRHYIGNSGVKPDPARVSALVVPHAGYVYSGSTAGFAYARIRGAKPGRIILLGRSHRYSFDRPSVWCEGGYESPLGVLPLDDGFARMLDRDFGGGPSEPHLHEPSKCRFPLYRFPWAPVRSCRFCLAMWRGKSMLNSEKHWQI
jgi:AmmeMemoRadiSam system protein B